MPGPVPAPDVLLVIGLALSCRTYMQQAGLIVSHSVVYEEVARIGVRKAA